MSRRSSARLRLETSIFLIEEKRWPQLPVSHKRTQGGKKPPLISGWKDRATLDVDQVRSWDKEFSDPNWGSLAGPDSFLGLDFDTAKKAAPEEGWNLSAQETFDSFIDDEGYDLTGKYIVRTPGGLHLPVSWHEVMEPAKFNATLAQHHNIGRGGDVVGNRGYLVNPGSVFEDGIEYVADDIEAPLLDLRKRTAKMLEFKAPQVPSERAKIVVSRPTREPSNESSPSNTGHLDKYTERALFKSADDNGGGIVTRLAALSPVKGSRNNEVRDYAFQLVAWSNADWNSLSPAEAERLFVQATNHLNDGDFTPDEAMGLWESAVEKAPVKERPATMKPTSAAPKKNTKTAKAAKLEPVQPEKRGPGRPKKPAPKISKEIEKLCDKEGNLDPIKVARHVIRSRNMRLDENGRLWYYLPETGVFQALIWKERGGPRSEIARILDAKHIYSPTQMNRFLARLDDLESSDISGGLPPIKPDRRAENAHLINMQNGVFNLRTNELVPHSPEFALTTQIAATYDADATCPTIERQIGLGVHEDSREEHIYDALAAVVLPTVATRRIVYFKGAGGDGKTTLVEEIVAEMIGARSTAHYSPVLLNHAKSDRVAGMIGKWANLVSELGDERITNTEILRSMTGGSDTTNARGLYERDQDIKWFGSMLLASNHQLNSTDRGQAMQRRMLFVSFPNKVEGIDNDFAAKLEVMKSQKEISGLFNKLLEAYRRMESRNWKFNAPRSSLALAEEFAHPAAWNIVNRWLAEDRELTIDRGNSEVWVSRPDIWMTFKAWAASVGIISSQDAGSDQDQKELPGRNKFFEYLRTQFDESRTAARSRHFVGIATTVTLRSVYSGSGRRRNKTSAAAEIVNERTGEIIAFEVSNGRR